MLEKMDISVVIGSYNQCDRLKRVIEGYSNQVHNLTFEVIVVDSFSTDGTAQMIDELKSCPFELNFIQRQNAHQEKQGKKCRCCGS